MTNKKKEYSNVEPAFRFKAKSRSNEGELKLAGYLNESDLLGDEVIELETSQKAKEKFGKNTDMIENETSYDIKVNIYRTNLPGSFILVNHKWPIFHISVVYSKSVVAGYLLDFYVYFTLDDEFRKTLTKPVHYINTPLKGSFSIAMEGDEGLKDEITKLMDSSEERAVDYVAKQYALSNKSIEDDDEDKVMKLIEKEVKHMKDYYNSLIVGIQLPMYLSDNIIINTYLIPLYKDKLFLDIITKAIAIREKKRREELRIDDDEPIEAPTKIFKIRDMDKNPDIVDKYFENK